MAKTKAIIYIVDDDLSVRRGLKRLMISSGYDAETFSSLGAFLVKKHAKRNAFLILDGTLPDLNLLDLRAELAKLHLRLPIIFLTAHDDPMLMQMAKRVGAAAFFQKPVDGQALLDALRWLNMPLRKG